MSGPIDKLAAGAELVRAVAKAILETDPTCDYDICEKRQQSGGLESEFHRDWWEALHEQAINAIRVVREHDKT